ncbi:MAG: hypothetical protein PHG85_03360 [Candidatus Altiarchaeota archaeon]|nr:hypothetical protein [Candidatus Altiarchaeota archaeon]
MSSISGVRDGGFDPRLSLLAIVLAVSFLFVMAFSVGVIALVAVGVGPADVPVAGVVREVTTTSRAATTTALATTTRRTTLVQSTHATTTRNPGEPTTTYLEYTTPPETTLPEQPAQDDENCTENPSYRGPFKSCGAKNLAWFDSWSR